MSAVIIDLTMVRAARIRSRAPVPSATPSTERTTPTFLFWTGASGTRYVHTVYDLVLCPPVEAANYVLVKRHTSGQRTVLSIGRATHAAPSLNLADIRQRSAILGANEVHVHLLACSADDGRRIEADLRGSLAPG
jgi:hypothetical protein